MGDGNILVTGFTARITAPIFPLLLSHYNCIFAQAKSYREGMGGVKA